MHPEGISYEFDLPLQRQTYIFMIKQFFRFSKVHQTLSRSRLRRFCSERCIAADADQKANCFYAAVCTLLSPQNFDSPFGLPQDDTLTLESPPASYLASKVPKTALAVFGTAVHLLPASIPSLSPENGSFRQYGFFGGQRGLSFPKESPLISYPYIFTSVTNVTIIGLRLVFW